MKIFISDFTSNDNSELIKEVKQKFSKRKYELGYISSSTDKSRIFFNSNINHLKKYGNFDYTYYDFDNEYNQARLLDLFSSDVIFLSGGNTFSFLKSLKQYDAIEKLNDFSKAGGVLIGLSAGAIIMTGDIEAAKFGDDNYCGLTDYKSLDSVDFEFMPHWEQDKSYLEQLKHYSKVRGKIIYTCNDGSGILVDNKKTKFYGEIGMIKNGNFTSDIKDLKQ